MASRVSEDARAWLAAPDEAAEVARLLVGFRDYYGRTEPPADTFLTGVERLIVRPDTEYLLAAAGDRPPGGVCQLRYRYGVWTASDDCWLEDLFVAEPDRRYGLGAALVSAAIERARERGCGRIQLDVNTANHAAKALYESLGFSPWQDHPGGDALYMTRKLA
jgi:GNAT superfamily N-acetyltransferase